MGFLAAPRPGPLQPVTFWHQDVRAVTHRIPGCETVKVDSVGVTPSSFNNKLQTKTQRATDFPLSPGTTLVPVVGDKYGKTWVTSTMTLPEQNMNQKNDIRGYKQDPSKTPPPLLDNEHKAENQYKRGFN
eukprot:TRINITY_DN684_c0_g1_i4.p1 TRINITY_DN684_c0_g1~~TRINITY_DN684_c0_g1_i4.p1  ORF type:complete len:130 (-),score=18.37 TRINITY_DN684_c0_g1_i4:1033-1422(-)